MYLVAFVGKERETYGQITALLNKFEAEKIILIKDSSTEKFPQNAKCEIISIDTSKDLLSLKTILKEKLAGSIKSEFEVALSIASGNGKEHMALLSALLSLPVGIKLIAFTKKGIDFLT